MYQGGVVVLVVADAVVTIVFVVGTGVAVLGMTGLFGPFSPLKAPNSPRTQLSDIKGLCLMIK